MHDNLRPRELKYPVDHLGNDFKGIKKGSYIPNFWESLKYLFKNKNCSLHVVVFCNYKKLGV